jgi:hypothetical protein
LIIIQFNNQLSPNQWINVVNVVNVVNDGKLQNFKTWKFQNLKISKFQNFKTSKFNH